MSLKPRRLVLDGEFFAGLGDSLEVATSEDATFYLRVESVTDYPEGEGLNDLLSDDMFALQDPSVPGDELIPVCAA